MDVLVGVVIALVVGAVGGFVFGVLFMRKNANLLKEKLAALESVVGAAKNVVK